MLDQLDQMQVTIPLSTDIPAVSSYAIGPIDPSHLIALHAHCSNGEECLLLVPKSLPLWILNHPEFRDGYEQNYFTEEGEDDKDWKQTIPHMVNRIYSKLSGKGFEDLASGKVDPDFGMWEIGYLLRDFTRLADTDQTVALTFHTAGSTSAYPGHYPRRWLLRPSSPALHWLEPTRFIDHLREPMQGSYVPILCSCCLRSCILRRMPD